MRRLFRALSLPTLAATLSVLVASGHTTVRAQDAAAPVERHDAQEQTPPAAPRPAAQPVAAPIPKGNERRPPAQNVNVRFDITITDQSGSNAPVTKTLNVIAADRESGSIRSKVQIPLPRVVPGMQGSLKSYNYVTLPLNIDIRPELVDGGRIKARLILNYETASPAKGGGDEPHSTSEVTANVIVVLDNGKPLIVSQSADAATDRKVIVEMKATILK